MVMCENCQEATYRPSTLSAVGSPANLFRRLVGGKGQRILGGCGPNSPAWWVRWDPVTSLWRTCLVSSLKGVPKSLLILPKWGSMRNGVLYLRPMLELPTYASGFLLWPTPVANDDNKSPEAHMAMKARMPGGPRKKPTSLNVMVKGIEAGMWPTPTSSDHKGAASPDSAKNWNERGTDLPEAVQKAAVGMWSNPKVNDQWSRLRARGPEGIGDGRSGNGGGPDSSWWAVEPGMGRVVNGLPGRVDRLRALGNAVVPQWAELIGSMILNHVREV